MEIDFFVGLYSFRIVGNSNVWSILIEVIGISLRVLPVLFDVFLLQSYAYTSALADECLLCFVY